FGINARVFVLGRPDGRPQCTCGPGLRLGAARGTRDQLSGSDRWNWKPQWPNARVLAHACTGTIVDVAGDVRSFRSRRQRLAREPKVARDQDQNSPVVMMPRFVTRQLPARLAAGMVSAAAFWRQ